MIPSVQRSRACWLADTGFSGVSEASSKVENSLVGSSASERPEGVLDLVGRDPPLWMGDGLHGERATDRGHLSGDC